MCVIRIEAYRALGAAIEAAVPELVGKVKAGHAPSGTEQTYPTLTIVPGPLKYEPAQEAEHATIGDPADGVVVFNVGAHSGAVQLRIVATTVGERMKLEQKVANLFMSQEGRPGILIVEVSACPDLANFIAAFEYDSDHWIDTDAFDRKLESLVMVTGVLPALVTREEVYEIDELLLGVTTDLDRVFTPESMVSPHVELVRINEDGTFTPVP